MHFTLNHFSKLTKQLEKGIDDIDEQNQLTLNERRRVIEELTKNLHASYSKLQYLRSQNENLMHDLKQEEQQNLKYSNEISGLKEKIITIKTNAEKEENRKNDMDAQMAQTKQKIDMAKQEQAEKAQKIIDCKKQCDAITVQIHAKIKDKEYFHEKARQFQTNSFAAGKETENYMESVRVIKD